MIMRALPLRFRTYVRSDSCLKHGCLNRDQCELANACARRATAKRNPVARALRRLRPKVKPSAKAYRRKRRQSRASADIQ
jgi:hypothetical protein